jgi:hypothetical protein
VRKGGSGHWSGGRKQTTVWQIPHRKSESGHGTQKPVECMKLRVPAGIEPHLVVGDDIGPLLRLAHAGKGGVKLMEWHVYENWALDRARIHEGDPGHCNHGSGIRSAASERNGKWHGPFDRDSAFEHASSLTRADIRPCPVCNP